MEHLLIILKIVKVDVLFYIHMSQLYGITYDLAGDGGEGSEKTVEATSKDANLLKDQSTVYTVCYGAAKDKAYEDSPTVSEFLKGSSQQVVIKHMIQVMLMI